jgi:hypothetical protein
MMSRRTAASTTSRLTSFASVAAADLTRDLAFLFAAAAAADATSRNPSAAALTT